MAKSGARLREYEVSLSWLEDAGLVHRIENVQTAETPLMVHKNKSSFKLYLFDCGLLAALSGLSPALITDENDLFGTFKGAFIENFAFQELIASHYHSLAYWTSNGAAEVDVIIENDGDLYPLEVKSGYSKQAKSLAVGPVAKYQ